MSTATDCTTSAFRVIDGQTWRCGLNGWQLDVTAQFAVAMRRPRFELGCPKAPDPKSGTPAGRITRQRGEGVTERHAAPHSARRTTTNVTTRRPYLTRAAWDRIREAFHYRCAYCGKQVDGLAREHMVPLSRGGDHSIENVVPACIPCNSSKSDRTPLEWFLGLRSPAARHHSLSPRTDHDPRLNAECVQMVVESQFAGPLSGTTGGDANA